MKVWCDVRKFFRKLFVKDWVLNTDILTDEISNGYCFFQKDSSWGSNLKTARRFTWVSGSKRVRYYSSYNDDIRRRYYLIEVKRLNYPGIIEEDLNGKRC